MKTTVTRYPTGCFGIDHNGAKFYWYGFFEQDAHDKLESLGVKPKDVKWQERYYDRQYDFGDPRCYAMRKYIPRQSQKQNQ